MADRPTALVVIAVQHEATVVGRVRDASESVSWAIENGYLERDPADDENLLITEKARELARAALRDPTRKRAVLEAYDLQVALGNAN